MRRSGFSLNAYDLQAVFQVYERQSRWAKKQKKKYKENQDCISFTQDDKKKNQRLIKHSFFSVSNCYQSLAT